MFGWTNHLDDDDGYRISIARLVLPYHEVRRRALGRRYVERYIRVPQSFYRLNSLDIIIISRENGCIDWGSTVTYNPIRRIITFELLLSASSSNHQREYWLGHISIANVYSSVTMIKKEFHSNYTKSLSFNVYTSNTIKDIAFFAFN
jgi:hypothetical protein